jgi:hypothetical protein
MYVWNRCKECGEKFRRAYDTDFCSLNHAKYYTFKLADDPERLTRMWLSGVNRTPVQPTTGGAIY